MICVEYVQFIRVHVKDDLVVDRLVIEGGWVKGVGVDINVKQEVSVWLIVC